MPWEEQMKQLFDNMSAQWLADLAKKPSITDTQRYNQLVAAFNGMHEAGAWPDDPVPSSLYGQLGPIIGYSGFAPIVVIYEAEEAEWGETWPIAYAA